MKAKIKHATDAVLKLNINNAEVLALLRILPAINHSKLDKSDTKFIAELLRELKEFKSAMELNDILDEIFNKIGRASCRERVSSPV